jgi:hypothetical protein
VNFFCSIVLSKSKLHTRVLEKYYSACLNPKTLSVSKRLFPKNEISFLQKTQNKTQRFTINKARDMKILKGYIITRQ